MSKGFYKVPVAYNEPVLNYAPGSPEKAAVKKALKDIKSKQVDLPMVIWGKEISTNNKGEIRPTYEIKYRFNYFPFGFR